jgi:hypothetical protein
MSRRTSRRSTGNRRWRRRTAWWRSVRQVFRGSSSVDRLDLDCSGGREKIEKVDWEKIGDMELKDEGEEKRSMKLVVILRPRAQEGSSLRVPGLFGSESS